MSQAHHDASTDRRERAGAAGTGAGQPASLETGRERSGLGAYYSGPWAEVHAADCVEVMRGLEADSFDAVITDPPYGLEFMNKEWDRLDGGDAEDGRDPGWQGGGGFSAPGIGERRNPWPSFSATGRYGAANPTCEGCGGRARGRKRCSCPSPRWKPIGKRRKHHDAPEGMTGTGGSEHGRRMQRWHERWAREALRVLKPGGHLMAFGGTRTSHRLSSALEDAGFELLDSLAWLHGQGYPKNRNVEKALAELQGERRRALGMVPLIGPESARRIAAGMGTALKPAHEPIIRARKPLSAGSVAHNVVRFGTGAINVDACRIDAEGLPVGRWPANVLLSCCDGEDSADADGPCPSCPVSELDRQSGRLKSGANPSRRNADKFRGVYSRWRGSGECEPARGEDFGGASRFFYVAKASVAEREEGLDGFAEKSVLWSAGTHNPGSFQSEGAKRTSRNPHPTVKPVGIMRWLLRLTVGPGALILDPFGGSGTTAVAATAEGVRCVLAEREEEYLPVIRARAEYAARKGPRPGERLGIPPRRPKVPEPVREQLSFGFWEPEPGAGEEEEEAATEVLALFGEHAGKGSRPDPREVPAGASPVERARGGGAVVGDDGREGHERRRANER